MRPDNNTHRICQQYEKILNELGMPFKLLDLRNLPADAFSYDSQGKTHPVVSEWVDQFIRPAEHLWFIVPEYNGSIPGALKCLLDFSDIRAWYNKKALLTGVATGRAGNLRGIDHLADILMHCKIVVHPNKLPISRIHELIKGEDFDEQTTQIIRDQIGAYRTDFMADNSAK